MINRLAAWFAALALLVLAGCGGHAVAPTDKAAIERIVHDYILAHPEIIPEAINGMQSRDVAKLLRDNRAEVETPFPGAVAGNPHGDVTLVEFFDYACPYCRAAHADVQRLIATDPYLRVVYRDFPVLSEGSGEAALAALSAAKQGKYAAFHDRMFETPGKVERERIVALVRAAGLDERRTAADFTDPRLKAEIKKNIDLGRALGLTGTPDLHRRRPHPVGRGRLRQACRGDRGGARRGGAVRRGRWRGASGQRDRRMTPAFDVALALRRIATVFWHDFAAIVVLGFGMVTLPQVALALAGTHSGSTVVATFGGMLRVLYVVIVSHGALARLRGKPLAPHDFARAGLAASPRAIGTGLLLGAGAVLVLVGLLLAGLAREAMLIRIAMVAAACAAAVIVAPAIPLALVTRAAPLAAVAAAARLTRGRRGGIAVVLGLVALTIVPARLVVAATVYGLGREPRPRRRDRCNDDAGEPGTVAAGAVRPAGVGIGCRSAGGGVRGAAGGVGASRRKPRRRTGSAVKVRRTAGRAERKSVIGGRRDGAFLHQSRAAYRL